MPARTQPMRGFNESLTADQTGEKNNDSEIEGDIRTLETPAEMEIRSLLDSGTKRRRKNAPPGCRRCGKN